MIPFLLSGMLLAAPAPAAPAKHEPVPIYLGLSIGHDLARTYGATLEAEPVKDVRLGVKLDWTDGYRINSEGQLPLQVRDGSLMTYDRLFVTAPEVEIPSHLAVRVMMTWRLH